MNKVFDIVSFLCLLGCWIQHKVRLGKFMRDSDSLQREGENLQAVWSPDAKLIAVLVSAILISHVILVLYANCPTRICIDFFLLCTLHMVSYLCMFACILYDRRSTVMCIYACMYLCYLKCPC